MEISKISFRNGQAWLAIRGKKREHIGTWHIIDPEFVRALKKEIPKKIFLE
jgi:hypothetical protein